MMFDVRCVMRTTLAIDDDVLAAARDLAAAEQKSIGEVISSLARKALTPQTPPARIRNGVPLLPVQPGSRPVTSEHVRQLEEELP
jgi:hypothetical protein